MKPLKYLLIVVALTLAVCSVQADDKVVVRRTTNVTELDKDIRLQEDIVDFHLDSIEVLNDSIKALKVRLDSLNDLVKGVKAEISALEKARKACEKEIKAANKTREATFVARDNLVYDQQIEPVLSVAYSKAAVEACLQHFEGMETKDVAKRTELVKNYGKYTQETREMLDKHRATFERLRWSTVGTEDEAYKKFAKDLKGLDYLKIYNKGLKDPNAPTIPYLDKVFNEILMLQRSGFNSKTQYDRVLNMLYSK